MAATQPPVGTPLRTPLELWATLNPNWLTGHGDRDRAINQAWFANVSARLHQLQQYEQTTSQTETSDRQTSKTTSTKTRPLFLIAEPDPLNFLASFWAALLADWNIALANPKWGDREWNATHQILTPTQTWPPRSPSPLPTLSPAPPLPNSSILIPTGGTSGQIKFAHHTWQTLLTATAHFCQTFPAPIHTYCVLPVHHVSGLMQLLRAWLTQAQVILTPFKHLETQPPLLKNPARWYISLVPTQLARLIAAEKSPWLSQFHAVLLGGAPPWPSLLTQAIQNQIPVRLSYGMTETAAMVAIQQTKTIDPQNPSSGSPLPHAKISIEVDGKQQPPGVLGSVVVRSEAIAHGYYNANSPTFSPQTFHTDDLGYLTPRGQLHITGRASNKIISGGENIYPAEVEAALRSTGQVLDVHVFGQPDSKWGEIVVAAFVPVNHQVTPMSLKSALSEGTSTSSLSHYKHPKRWIPLEAIPRNEQGKLIESTELQDMLKQSANRRKPS